MNDKDYYHRAMSFFHSMVEENGMFHVPSKEEIKALKKDGVKILGLPIPRIVVESNDVTEAVRLFKNLEVAKSYYRGSVLLTISGYDQDSRELFQIKEVVNWIRKLLLEVPQAIYFINDECWSYIKPSIAKEVKMLGMDGKPMSMYEVSKNLQLGLPVTQYALLLTVEGHVLDNIVREIKLLGARVNDLKGANAVAQTFSSTFEMEG